MANSNYVNHQLASERDHVNWMRDSLQKFRLFFSGLVFAILSYSLQVDFSKIDTPAQMLYSSAWVMLLVTGLLALKEAGGLARRNLEDNFNGLSPNIRAVMWLAFAGSLLLLGLAKWAPYL